jgi:hypothetical protein
LQDDEAQLAAYEAWIVTLTARQKELASQRSFYLRLFVALPFVAGLGFLVHLWIGAAALFTGVLMCAFGFYVVMGRESEYVREIALTRRAADDLRAARRSA